VDVHHDVILVGIVGQRVGNAQVVYQREILHRLEEIVCHGTE
jgi:hypothetical protein